MADRLAIIQSEESIREFQAIIAACKDVVSNFKDVEKGAKAVNKALNSGKPREYANAIRDLSTVSQQFANIERNLAASMARTASLEAQQARAARDQAAARRDNAAAAREEARVRDQATRQAEREARANSQSTSAFKNLQREMQAVRQKARDYKAEIFNLKRALADGSITQAEYNRRLAEFSRNARTSTREAITLQREIRRINQDTIPSDQRGGALSGRVTDIIKGITGAGAINKIVDSMASIATDGYETIKILNAQNLALKSVFDTQAQISFQKEYLIDLTDKYGLELVSTTEAYTKYSAAVKGTYLEGEKARKIYDSFSGASAKLGLSAEQNTGIFRALEQMISKGKIQAEELRGQLGDRMAGAFRLFADGMGVTTAQLDKMLKDGEVVADTVLPKVADRLAKVYNLDTAERIDTIAASQNRLKNEWTSFLDDIAGNKENIDLLTGGIEALSYGVQFLLDILIKDGAAGREILTGLIDVISSLLEVLAAVGGVSDTTSTKMEKLQATLTYISADVNILASAIKYLTSVVSNFFSTMFEEDGWDKFNKKMEKSADSLINAYETWDKKTSDADKLFTGLTANERAIRQREEETKRYTKNWEDAKAAKAAYFNYKGKYFSTATGRNTGKSLDDYIDVGDRLEKKVKVKPTILPDKTKKPKAASLSAAQKDQMNILQAQRDTAIAYLTQSQNEGLINEQQFQEKRIAIIKDYAAKVTSYLKGQNAKEKQVSASVMLKASSEIKASLKDQADYFSKENEETYKKSQNLIERQAKDLEKK
ncbi:tape measure protein [Chryseobacterium proteolyticum]|uniref:tape measure protein n=1 Tax=Chryseobacterium proteolyticum TaxID=118127 RepID=UPI003983003F